MPDDFDKSQLDAAGQQDAAPSILFAGGETGGAAANADCLADLNLGTIIDAVTAGKDEYDLKPFFYHPLRDVRSITYRQEVMRDLEEAELFKKIEAFAERLRDMRQHLVNAEKLYYKHEKESWFVDAVEIYCDAVDQLERDLSEAGVASRGFVAFRGYLTRYRRSDRFMSLLQQTKQIKADLASIKYCLIIKGNKLQVRKYESESDYGGDVLRTFEKFKQGEVKDYSVKFRPSTTSMNHIEAKALEFVARLYPDVFANMDVFCRENEDYMDDAIAKFDREIQFYVTYQQFINTLSTTGLHFCYPQIGNESKEIHSRDGFDLALAHKLAAEKVPVVCNDFSLTGPERIFVVTGPNQGGKTTFARVFGQLHYLASLGCPVPGRDAALFLGDEIFTHFEREEDIGTLHGKLEDDLVRIHDILRKATSNSIIIMNEIFTSTTLRDAIVLSKAILGEISRLDALGVCVTFIDELASLSEKTVSLVSVVDAGNPAVRTFKVIRKSADGLAYALSIAEKYRLTFDRLKERMKS